MQLSVRAVRDMRKLDPVARRRLQAVIEVLGENPRPPSAVKLVGGKGEWRVRSGDYRLIYEIDDDRVFVLVISMGHRREVYRTHN